MSFVHLSSVACTDVGRKRSHNEDALAGFPEQGVMVVADGMGGAAGGEVASQAVVDFLSQRMDAIPGDEPALPFADRVCAVAEAIGDASRWIKAHADAMGVTGTGTTVVSLVFDWWRPDHAVAVHAGDSRAYLFRGGNLSQLTRDHSVATSAGVRETSLPAIFRGVVTRAVGLEPYVALDLTPVRINAGDLFLVCSDGLTKMVSDAGLVRLLRDGMDQDLDQLALSLVDAANRAGGDDNISVILVRVATPLPDAEPGASDEEVPEATVVFPETPDGDPEAAADEDADRAPAENP